MTKNDRLSTEPSLEVLGLFRIIFKSSTRHFETIEKSVGVTGAQLWALSEIANADGIKVSNLAKAMSLHQSTTSNLIEKMAAKGLVMRVRDDSDRRVVKVRVTEVGHRILNSAPAPVRGLLPDALMRMSPEQLQVLKSHLESLLRLMGVESDQFALEPLGVPIMLSEQ